MKDEVWTGLPTSVCVLVLGYVLLHHRSSEECVFLRVCVTLDHQAWGVALDHPDWGVALDHQDWGVALDHPDRGVALDHQDWGVAPDHQQ